MSTAAMGTIPRAAPRAKRWGWRARRSRMALRSLPPVQHLADFVGQLVAGEGLAEELHTLVQHPAVWRLPRRRFRLRTGADRS